MAQAIRSRLIRTQKKEQEIHIFPNSSDRNDGANIPLVHHSVKSKHESSRSLQKQVIEDDYVAPSTAKSLRSNSHWLIVRRNLHRIRFMGFNERSRDSNLPSFYLGLQMKRELKRAQEEIKNIDREENFRAVQQFLLETDNKRVKTYNTSHVKPGDALIYDRLGEEPLALQNLLYYFSKQDVPHGTLFWEFLNEVNHVLSMQRKRTVRVQRLQKLAFILAIILYSIIGLMLLLLILSVITTATRMNDPEIQWMKTDYDKDFKTALSL